MNNCGELFFYVFSALVFLCYVLSRSVDENGMDSYDREYGIAIEGRTRGLFGTIYESDGSYNIWTNVLDTNPWWYNY